MSLATTLPNVIGDKLSAPSGSEWHEVLNPATGVLLTEFNESTAEDIELAVSVAKEAFALWSAMSVVKRCRILFTCKEALEQRFEEIAECLIRENGKTYADAVGEVRRGLEVLEFACGMPSLAKGDYIQDIASDIDGYVFKEPLGVVAGICPFNFPAMIPMWMFPVAIACGNTFILKPSDKCPMTGSLIAQIMHENGLPSGVLNVVQGGQRCSEALVDHPDITAVSFVGSTPAAKAVWQRATAQGKRCQAMGGAKNYLIVTPDADPAITVDNIIGSAYGCAGERCMATSVVVLVGNCGDLLDQLIQRAAGLCIGDGINKKTELGPLINRAHREKVVGWINLAIEEGADLVLDGRNAAVDSLDSSCFLGACILDNVTPVMRVAQEEIFGPVLSVMHADTVMEAVEFANSSRFGNGASIFTGSGAAAHLVRKHIQCGMVGINAGVPAPMAFFSFGGHKQSMFGDLKVQGPESIDFYTKRKVVTERWIGDADTWE